jgi:hypothetical protein
MARMRSQLIRFREARREAERQRRLKRRRTLIIGAAVLVVLAPIIASGAILENRGESRTAVPAPAQAATTEGAQTPSAAEPKPDEEPTQYDENNLRFGQTGRYVKGGYAYRTATSVEFTVSAPEPFTPSENAEFEDVFGYPYGGKGPRQPDNVYFTVTVKNLEEDEPYDISVQSSVKDSGDDEEQSYVDDGDIGSVSDLGRDGDIQPGKSATVKDGWSLANADNVRYELRFGGVGGESFYFTK